MGILTVVAEDGVSGCTQWWKMGSAGVLSGGGGWGQRVYSQWWRRMGSVSVLTVVVEED